MKKTFPEGFYWGEKWGVRSDSISLRKRLPAILNKIATTCTVPVRKLFARLAQLYCEYLEQYGEQVDSVCKTRKYMKLFAI